MTATQIYRLLRSLSNQDWLALRAINFLLDEGEKNVTQLYSELRVEQPVMSQVLKQCAPLFKKERRGKSAFYTVNLHKWQALILMCHDLGNSKMKYIEELSTEKQAIKRTEAIFRARFARTKGDTRQKIFDFILENPGTPLNRIYRSLGIEQCVSSVMTKELQMTGWVISQKCPQNWRKRTKTVDHAFVAKVQVYIDRLNELPTHRVWIKENDTGLRFLEVVSPNGIGKVVDFSKEAGIGLSYLLWKTINIETIVVGSKLKCYDDEGIETYYDFIVEGISAAL